MTTEENDPLSSLLTDAGAIDRQAIADALQDVVGIDTASHGVVTKQGFERLTSRQQIMAVLLGVKAAMLLGVSDQDGAGPSTVVSASGIPSGTVRRILRELLAERLVSQSSSGDYTIAHHQVTSAIRALTTARESTSPPARRTSSRKAAKPKRSSAKVADAQGTEGQKSTPKAKQRHSGTSAAIRDLIESGFFDSGRTLGELRDHLRKRRGITTDLQHLSPVMLRLLRSGVLERDENEEGTYEYSRPKD